MSNLLYFIYLIPLSLCAIFSLRSFRLKWPKPYRYFSIFLIITLLNEILAISWKVYLYKVFRGTPSNIWIYNIYIVPEYLFYFFFFYLILRNEVKKSIVNLLSLTYGIFSMVNLFLVQGLDNLNSYTIIVGNIVLILLSILYFNKNLNEKILLPQKSQPTFWISLAVFIFSVGSLPYFIFMNYLIKVNIGMAIALFYILLILNTLMYSLYLIAFLCSPHSLK